jgi:ATP-grasp domain
MQRVLLVGSSYSAIPLLNLLRSFGFFVGVCGNLRSDPCHALADVSFFVDYSDPKQLTEVFESGGFHFIVPSCNDASYNASSSVAGLFNLPGFDSFFITSQLHEKSLFKGVLSKLSVRSPRYLVVSPESTLDIRVDLSFPLLVKPVDSFSGRGQSLVASSGELELAVQRARKFSKSRKVVIEEFVEGSLHSHSAFIHRGEIAVDFFVDEFCTVYPYQVNCSNHPSSLPSHVRAELRNSILSLVEHLKLVDGLMHTQFLLKNNSPYVIECMRRCPGDLYGTLIQRSTKFDYFGQYLAPFIGRSGSTAAKHLQAESWFRHTVSSSQRLVFESFKISTQVDNLEIFPLLPSGNELLEAPYGKAAILFFQKESLPASVSSASALTSLVSFGKN